MADTIYDQIDYFIKSNKFKSAFGLLKNFPRSAKTFSYEGLIYYKQKDLSTAEALFKKSLDLDKNQALSWYYLGRCYDRKARYSEAQAAYVTAYDLDDSLPKAKKMLEKISFYFKGQSFAEKGDHVNAISEYKKGLKLNSSDRQLNYNMGISLRSINKFRRAIKYFDLSIKSDPKYPYSYLDKGLTLLEMGKYNLAENSFRLAKENGIRVESDSKWEHIIKFIFRKYYSKKLTVTSIQALSEGVLSNCFKITLSNNDVRFFKTNTSTNPSAFNSDISKEKYLNTLIREKTSLPVANVDYTDSSKKIFPFNFLISSTLEGKSLNRLWSKISDSDKSAILHQLGIYIAQLHEIKSNRYGYILSPLKVNPSSSSWYDFLKILFENSFSNNTVLSESEISFIKNKITEKKIFLTNNSGPRLVHNDFWLENILVYDNTVSGIIDFETSMFAEPEYELALIEAVITIDLKYSFDFFLKGYQSVRSISSSYNEVKYLYMLERYVKTSVFKNNKNPAIDFLIENYL